MPGVRLPLGSGLLVIGSGVYWVLSSSLIVSFSVLTSSAGLRGGTMVLGSGIVAFAAGVWALRSDLNKLQQLTSSDDGWIFILPFVLAVADVWLTVFGLSSSFSVVELNPLVGAAVEAGGIIFFSFIASYMLLSEGVGLIMISLGGHFARISKLPRPLPYSIVCGAASLGTFSNLLLLSGRFSESAALAGGVTMGVFLSVMVYKCLVELGLNSNRTRLRFRTSLCPDVEKNCQYRDYSGHRSK